MPNKKHIRMRYLDKKVVLSPQIRYSKGRKEKERFYMVHIFAAYIDNLPDPQEQASVMEGLPQERREKIMKHKTAEGRKQSLGAGLLLKRVLEKYGVSQAEIAVKQNGKPETAGICFNLSHSGSLAICAVSDRPVGCDAEKTGPARRKVAKRFFSEQENRYLEQFEGREQDQAFCRIWTMREAYIKMTGEGMRLDFRKFEIVPVDAAEFQVFREERKETCFLREYEVDGYCVSVCAEEKEFAAKPEWV